MAARLLEPVVVANARGPLNGWVTPYRRCDLVDGFRLCVFYQHAVVLDGFRELPQAVKKYAGHQPALDVAGLHN